MNVNFAKENSYQIWTISMTFTLLFGYEKIKLMFIGKPLKRKKLEYFKTNLTSIFLTFHLKKTKKKVVVKLKNLMCLFAEWNVVFLCKIPPIKYQGRRLMPKNMSTSTSDF